MLTGHDRCIICWSTPAEILFTAALCCSINQQLRASSSATGTAPAQDMFLQSHGMGAPTHTAAQLLVSCPLPHPGREAVFRALTAVPHLGPQVCITNRKSPQSSGPALTHDIRAVP